MPAHNSYFKAFLTLLARSDLFHQLALQGSWLVRSAGISFWVLYILEDPQLPSFIYVVACTAFVRPLAEAGLPTTTPLEIASRSLTVASTPALLKTRLHAGLTVYGVLFLLLAVSRNFTGIVLTNLEVGILCLTAALDGSPLLMAIGQQHGLFRRIAIGSILSTFVILLTGLFACLYLPNLAGCVLLIGLSGPISTLCMLGGLLFETKVSEMSYAAIKTSTRINLLQTFTDFLTGLAVPYSVITCSALSDGGGVVAFRLALQFANLCLATFQSFVGVDRQRINRALLSRNTAHLSQVLSQLYTYILLITAAYIVFFPTLSSFFFGSEKTRVSYFLWLSCYFLSNALLSLFTLLTPVIFTKKELLAKRFVGLVVTVGFAPLLGYPFGANGVAAALSLGTALSAVLVAGNAYRQLGLPGTAARHSS